MGVDDGWGEKEAMAGVPDLELPTVPSLVFVRKYGWVVVVPLGAAVGLTGAYKHAYGFTRPGKVRIERRDVLASAPLPAAPETAR